MWEWLGTSVLGLQAGVLVWLVKDYLQFRLSVVPNLLTQQQCLHCQNETRQDLREIKRHLEDGQSQFKRIAVTLARLCTKLGVNCPQ